MIHFVVGTRAQLLKLAPVMVECRRRGLAWRWIYTAQHQDTVEQLLQTFDLPPPDHVVVRWNTEAKSLGKMAHWFSRMLLSLPRSRRILNGQVGRTNVVVTHGDTFTTWFGALFGKLTRTKVMHVESGLRSFNFRKPFPEELNRVITFRLTDFYACQNDGAIANLRQRRGTKLNTHGNTQIDTLRFGVQHAHEVSVELPAERFVVATIHRYENIFDRARFESIVALLETIAEQYQVVFIKHPATELQLERLGLVNRVLRNPRITLLPRLEYLPFIAAVSASEFVVTDGGGNQLELAYLGKPTLIFRDEVEQEEGLGETAVLSKLDPPIVRDFVANYERFAREPQIPDVSPSAVIVDFLQSRGFGGPAG